MRKGSDFWRRNMPLARFFSVVLSIGMVLSLMPAQGVAEARDELFGATSDVTEQTAVGNVADHGGGPGGGGATSRQGTEEAQEAEAGSAEQPAAGEEDPDDDSDPDQDDDPDPAQGDAQPTDQSGEPAAEPGSTDAAESTNAESADQQSADADANSTGDQQEDASKDAAKADDEETVANAQAGAPVDLKPFYSSIGINGATQISNHEWQVDEGQNYNIALYFAEQNGGIQFPNDDTQMYFQLPVQFNAVGQPTSQNKGTLPITVSYDEGGSPKSVTIRGNTWWVDNGVVYVQWNTQDSNFETLTRAGNARFNVGMTGNFSKSDTQIKVGDKDVINVNPQEHNVQSHKSGNYDGNGHINYAITLTSKGANTNVNVKDQISQSGSALSVQTHTISATSNKTGTINLAGIQSSTSGFSYTIPSMQDGETITFTYTANVDLGKIDPDGMGTVEQTENGIEVKWDGHPTPDTHKTNFEHQIKVTSTVKSTKGDIVYNGNKATATWKIVVNQEKIRSIASGSTLKDVIDNTGVPHKYSGNGIHLVVKDGAGATVRQQDIGWGQLSSYSDTAWTYTFPGDSQAYEYEFTYTTEADFTGLSAPTYKLKNTPDGPGPDTPAEATAKNPSGNTTELHKEAGEYNPAEQTIEWVVTFIAPRRGLSKAVVTDMYPTANINGQQIYEKVAAQDVESHITGLVNGESAKVSYNDTNFVITFYKTPQGAEGLKGTGEDRTITVRFKTKVDPTWLAAVLDWQRSHTNKVELTANDIVVTAEATKVITDQTINKTFVKSWETIDENGTKLPIFDGAITFSGVTDGSFNNGELVVADLFDTSILDLLGEVKIAGGNQYYQGDGERAVTRVDSIAGGKNFVISKTDIPKTEGGEYYPYYCIRYRLCVPNTGKLWNLNNKAASSAGGMYYLTNTADWGGLKITVGDYYEYGIYTKELLTDQKKLVNMSSEDRTLSYSLNINRMGYDLNPKGDTITVTDTLSDTVAINPLSIRARDDAGNDVATDLDISGYTMYITIPDNKHVTITYDVEVVKAGKITNTANVNGQIKTTEHTATLDNTSGGTASLYSIKLVKYKAGNLNQRLPGAVFELYYGTNGTGTDGQPVRENGQTLRFTSGPDGLVTIGEGNTGWHPSPETWYMLREVQAPAGYKKLTYDLRFKISESGIPNYSQYIYRNGDTLTVKNYEGTQIPVRKEWSDGTAAHANDSIVVQLQQRIGDGGWSNTVKLPSDDDNSTWNDTQQTLTLNSANGWAGTFADLPKTYDADADNPQDIEYRIAEISNPANYTTSISGDATQGYVITNNRDEGSLKVGKTVRSNTRADEDRPFNFEVQLSDTTINGTYGDIVFTNGNAKFSLRHNEARTATKLPASITYTVTETAVDGFTTTWTSNTGSITEGNKATGKIERGVTSEANFKNDREEGGLEVKKTVMSNLASDYQKPFDFTVTLYDTSINGTYGGMTFTNGVANFQLKANQGLKAEGLPAHVRYAVTEAADKNFTTTWSGDTTTGAIAKDATTSVTAQNARKSTTLTVSKKVLSNKQADQQREFTFHVKFDPAPDAGDGYGVTIDKDGVATFTLRHNESQTIGHLPVGIGYTVTEDAADGFTLTGVTGDTGTLSTTPATSEFTNTPNQGGLVVFKKVTSTLPSDYQKEFEFHIVLSDVPNDQTITGTYGDIEFTNNEATVFIKDNQTLMATDLPAGTHYSVFEVLDENDEELYDSGYATDNSESGEIASDQISSVGIYNTRVSGKLVVSKSVRSNTLADKNLSFAYTVTLPNNPEISGTFGDMTFTEGKATFTLKDGETITADGLPKGIQYRVVETRVDGFSATLAGTTTGTADAAAPGASGWITNEFDSRADFINSRTEGGLKVSKTVVSDLDSDKQAGYRFAVTLNQSLSGTYGGMTFTNGIATFTLKNGESLEATGLPAGLGYSVTESSASGMAATWTGETATSNGVSGTIRQNVTADASVKNERVKGDLEVTKTVKTNTEADKIREFRFTVKLDTPLQGNYGGMTFDAGVATFILTDGATATATGLPVGIGYEVQEQDYYGFISTWTGETGTISTQKSEAKFTNSRVEGDLEVQKKVDSIYSPDKDAYFDFRVELDAADIEGSYGGMTFDAGVATFRLKHGQKLKAEHLPAGIGYAVTETTPQGFTTTWSGSTSGIIEGNATKSVTATNSRIYGQLSVSKKLISTKAADAGEPFTFNVTLKDTGAVKGSTINGKFGDMTFTNGVAQVKIAKDQTATASGLPYGIDYAVTEEDSPNFTLVGSTGDTGTITGATSQAVFTNQRDDGGLSIYKSVVGASTADMTKDFAFEVTIKDVNGDLVSDTYRLNTGTQTQDVEFVDGKATITLKQGETKVIAGIPTGYTYQVEEKMDEKDAAGEPLYRVFNNAGGDSNTEGKIVTNTIKEAVSNVQYINWRQDGDILLSKKLVSGRSADSGQEFTFTVTLADSGISGTYGDVTFQKGVATVTLADGETAHISGVPAGIDFTVSEDTTGGFATGVTSTRVPQANVDDTGNINTDGLPTTTKQTNTVSDTIVGNTIHKFDFTNTRQPGKIQLSKTLVSDRAADASQEFVFRVRLNGTTDEAANGTYTLRHGAADDANAATEQIAFANNFYEVRLKGGETKTIEGLPTGINYYVTESSVDGFKRTGMVGDTGSVGTTPAKVEVTNQRTDGKLRIEKKLVSDLAADAGKQFEFVVELDGLTDEAAQKEYEGVQFHKDAQSGKAVATIKLKGGSSKTLKGLPTNINYTVTEKDAPGFQVDGNTRTGVIATKQATALFTNTGAKGDLELSKKLVSTATVDTSADFEFTIVFQGLSDEANNKKFGDVQLADGKATVKLKGGETVALTGLPAGSVYTITEAKVDNVKTEVKDAAGQIEANEVSGIVTRGKKTEEFINTRETGGIRVVKSVQSSTATDKNKEFTFVVKFDSAALNGEYGKLYAADGSVLKDAGGKERAVNFENGSATFMLKDTQYAQITGLPVGVKYTVTENSALGFTATQTGTSEPLPLDDKSNPFITGTVTSALADVPFTNVRTEGNLEVQKLVVSDLDQDNKTPFAFTVLLDDTSINGTYGDLTFVNGKAEVSLTHNQKVQATGIPANTGYRVTEAADPEGKYTVSWTGSTASGSNYDYTVDASGLTFAGKIWASDTVRAIATNTHIPGDLEVTKSVVSTSEDDYDKDFDFRVTLDPAVSGTFGNMTFNDDGVATFSLKHDGTATAKGLPVGVKYTVEEQLGFDDHFIVAKTGETGSIAATPSKAQFTNTHSEGGLYVNKRVQSSREKDKVEREFEFTVTVYTNKDKTQKANINGAMNGGTRAAGAMNFTNGVATFKLKDGDTAYALGLEEGWYYVVEEKADNDFTTTTTGNVEAEVVKDANATVTFTNTRKTGNLEVQKVVEDSNTTQEFSFTVTLDDTSITGKFGAMTFNNGVANFTLANGQKATATNLPAGVAYTVTETHADGYTTTWTNTTRGHTYAVEYNEMWQDTQDEWGANIHVPYAEFKDILEDGEIVGNEEHRWIGDEDYYDQDGNITRKWRNADATTAWTDNEGTEHRGAITANVTDNATFTNTPEYGWLEVQKHVKSDVESDTSKKFKFRVELADTSINGTYGQMEFTNGVAEFELAHNEVLRADKLPKGLEYTVYEEYDSNFFCLASDAYTSIGYTGEGSYRYEKDPADGNVVDFINERQTTNLIVQKHVRSNTKADKNKSFHFKVTLDEAITGDYFAFDHYDDDWNEVYSTTDGMHFEKGVAEFDLKDGETKQAHGLPAGIGYTVEEMADDGYVTTSMGATGMLTAEAIEHIDEGDWGGNVWFEPVYPVADFTNVRKQGGLEVSKKLVSDAAADQDAEFDFTVTITNADGSTNTAVDGTYGAMTFAKGVATFKLQKDQSIVAEDLPAGATYTVRETALPGLATGLVNDQKTGTVVENTITKEEFTNTRETGGFEVQKKVVSDASADHSREFGFTVRLSDSTIEGAYGGMIFNAGVAAFRLRDTESLKAEGLPTGITYTITETTAAGFTTTWSGKTSAVIQKGTSPLVVATNTRVPGGLTISKELVTGRASDLANNAAPFEFTVTLSDKTIGGTYSDVVFTKGVATVRLRGNESKTIEGLPTGISYTVTEASADGFELTGKTGDKGAITAAGAHATFQNSRVPGELTVSKELVSKAAADKSQKFIFTIAFTGMTDEAANATYNDIKLTDGRATIELAGGESRTLTGLPTGVDYKVTEMQVDGYSLTGKVGDEGTVAAQPAEAKFTNTRDEGKLKVTKVVSGTTLTDAEKQAISFVVSGPGGYSATKTLAEFSVATGDTEPSWILEDLPVGDYVVQETGATRENWTVTTTYSIGPEGKVAVQKDQTAEVTVTNAYDQHKGDLTIAKTVTGAPDEFKDKEFKVTVQNDEGGWIDANGAVSNTEVKLTVSHAAPLTIKGLPVGNYHVTECDDDRDTIPNYSFVRVTGEATVAVTLNGSATVGLVNDYTQGNASISATKAFEDWGKAQSFDFTLTAGDNDANVATPMPEGSTNGAKTVTVTRTQPTAAFGEIAYTKAGTYNYKVNEVLGDAPGVTYDTSDHNVVVKVATQDDGKLKATVEYENEDGLVITNTYAPIKRQFEVTKNYVGDADWSRATSFTFDLAAGNSTLTDAQGNAIKSPMPATTVAVATKEDVTATFDQITFERPGTYEYTITERDDHVGGIAYDTTPHTVKVEVAQNQVVAEGHTTNELSATVKYDTTQDSLTVTNTCSAKGSLELSGHKAINAKPETMDLSGFEFLVTDVTSGNEADAAVVATGSSDTDGNITFTPISYTLADAGKTFIYKVTEKAEPSKPHVVNSTAEVMVKAIVVDNHDGTLTAVKAQDSEVEFDAVNFTNEYEVGKFRITKNVKVAGNATTGTEADGTYQFQVTGPNDYSQVFSIEVKDGKSGTVEVGDLYEGTYTVTELTSQGTNKAMRLIGAKEQRVEVQVGQNAEVKTVEFTNSKPGTPTFDKKIKDTNDSTGETSGWQDSADYDIGDAVPYKLTATLPADVTDYPKYHITFTDQMEESLTFNEDSVRVELNGTELAKDAYKLTTVDAQNFWVRLDWAAAEGQQTISDSSLNGATVDVYFNATLNEGAVLGKVGNVNAAKLSYSNSPAVDELEQEAELPWDYVIAFTYKVDINKLNEKHQSIEGAEFKLEKLIKATEEGAEDTYKELALTASGNTFSATGLDDGDYVLTETKAPEGNYELMDPIEFTVTAGHVDTWDYTSNAADAVNFNGDARTQILQTLTGDLSSGVLDPLAANKGGTTLAVDEDLATLSANVVNTQPYTLKIVKEHSDIDLAELTSEQRAKFRFEVYGPDDLETLLDSATLADTDKFVREGDADVWVLNCPGPGIYRVVERRPSLEWVEGDLVSVVDYGVHTNGRVNLVRRTVAEVTATNIYNHIADVAQLGVRKDLVGQSANANEEFEFVLDRDASNDQHARVVTIEDADGQQRTATLLGDQLPVETHIKVKAGETGTFDPIGFTADGTYYFTIAEVEPEAKTPGMTYDTTAKWAKVVVENGVASTPVYGSTREEVEAIDPATVEEGDAALVAAVTNTSTGDLAVRKELVASNVGDFGKDTEFAFTVTLGDTSINGIYGNMEFNAGVATFTLKGGESKSATGLVAGTTYTVTEAEAKGFKLTGKTGDTGTIAAGQTAAATFTNTREEGGLKVVKHLVGVSLADLTDANKKAIEFTVTGPNGFTATNTLDNFKVEQGDTDPSWTLAGLPAGEYKVSEKAPALVGTSLTTIYEVVATQAQAGDAAGESNVEAQAEAQADADFVNTFNQLVAQYKQQVDALLSTYRHAVESASAKATEALVQHRQAVDKAVTAYNKAIDAAAANASQVTLQGVTAAMQDLVEAVAAYNRAAGIADTSGGATNGTATPAVTATGISVVVATGQTAQVAVNNTYVPNGKAGVVIGATKKLSGRTLKAGEFSFQLKDKDGKVLQTKSNNAKGEVAFDAINYDAAGTYEYTISEVKGNVANVTYDTHSAKVQVVVAKDAKTGKLAATVAYDSKASNTFNNTYTPPTTTTTKTTGTTGKTTGTATAKTADPTVVLAAPCLITLGLAAVAVGARRRRR